MDLENKLGLMGMLVLAALGVVAVVYGVQDVLAPLLPTTTHPLAHL